MNSTHCLTLADDVIWITSPFVCSRPLLPSLLSSGRPRTVREKEVMNGF
jgi:hypothetical protein